MDLSGKFTSSSEPLAASEAAEIAAALADFAERGPTDAAPLVAVAWRDGQAIPVELVAPAEPRPRPVWPEHIAIAALFLSTWLLAANHLRL